MGIRGTGGTGGQLFGGEGRIMGNRKKEEKQFGKWFGLCLSTNWLIFDFDIMGHLLAPETNRMCPFLGPETDIMVERY